MVKITDQELIDALQRCYSKHGEISVSILNNTKNNYPTQPTYSYRFDGGLEAACEKAGVPYKSSQWDRDSLIQATQKFFNKNGDVGVRHFAEPDNELPSSSTLYEYFDSFDDLIEKTDVSEEIREQKRENKKVARANANKKYSSQDKEELIEHLWWVMKQYGDAKTNSINDAPGPSTNVYTRIFGSLPSAREEAGLNKFDKESLDERLNIRVSKYEEDADGHIYVIKMIRAGEIYYYVGSSISLKKRLNSHINANTSISLHHTNEHGDIDELNLEPHCISRIENLHKKDNESDTEFNNRMKSKEHVVSYKIASAFNTHKVLGGK